MLKDRLLILQNDKTYQITNFRHFFIYGNYLQAQGQSDKACVCFNICHKLDETRSLFSSFYDSLLWGKFTVSWEQLSFFKNTQGSLYEGDYIFYLKLLSNLIKLPSDLYKRVKNAELSEISSSYIPSTVIKSLCEEKFAKGIKCINDRYPNREIPRELAIIRRMFTDILEHKERFKDNVIDYIHSGNIGGLYLLLKEEGEKLYLDITFKYMLMILTDIMKMSSSKEVITVESYTKETLSELIKTKNYVKALLLALEVAFQKGIKREDNHLGIVLGFAVREIHICGGNLDEMLYSVKNHMDEKEILLALRIIEEYLYVQGKASYYPFVSMLVVTVGITSEDIVDLLRDVTAGEKIPFKKYVDIIEQALQEKNIDKAVGYRGILKNLIYQRRINTLNFENINTMAKLEVRIEGEKKFVISPTEQ